MQLSIKRADLARAVTAVGRAVEARNTVPVLSMLRLSADGDRLTLRGTDLDVEVTASAAASTETAGETCVNAKLLTDIAKKAGNDDVSLTLEGEQLVVKSGRSRFSLATLPASDFPDLRAGGYDATFDIDLAALFAPVQFAISTEETRYYLNGIFFKGEFDKTIAVATDGHRLSRHHVAASAEFAGIIVPRKIVGLLPKGSVKVSVSDSKIRVEAGDLVIVSKLIDGTFPDYNRVIPTANDKIITVDRDEIMKAADRVSTISSERGRAVRFSIAPGAISLSVSNPDSGSATDEIAAEYSGEPFEIGFNSQYIRDLFSVAPSGPVTMALLDGGAPGVITSAGFEGLTLVLMPMRV